MVGVASPLFRVPGAPRFHTGLAAGMITSALFLTFLLIPVNLALTTLPWRLRAAAVALAAIGLAALDLLGRTPHIWRQVPQRFGLQGLRHGRLGLAYGLDLGLHVTTQKSTSLLWVAILGSVALGSPGAVAGTLLTAAVVQPMTTALLSALDQRSITDFRFWGWSARSWI